MEAWTFENANMSDAVMHKAKSYVDNWDEIKRNHMGCLFWGPVGTGKSEYKQRGGMRMNPKALQYLMGHSDISVTLNTYTHVNLKDAGKEVARIRIV